MKINQALFPRILAIVNLTPDSFSDGGQYFDVAAAQKKITDLLLGPIPLWGIDVGAESTAPQSQSVTAAEEWQRWQQIFFPALKNALSVLAQKPTLQSPKIWLSVDTYRPEIFAQVAKFMSELAPQFPLIWNDVTGIWDQETVDVLKSFPHTLYIHGHTLLEQRSHVQSHLQVTWPEEGEDFLYRLQQFFLNRQKQILRDEGEEFFRRLIWDPCWGFSKNRNQNLTLLHHFPHFLQTFPHPYPWLVGLSRKSFLRPQGEETIETAEWRHFYWITHFLQNIKTSPLIFRVHRPELVQVASEIPPSLAPKEY